jgi:hypothetical protein
MGYYGAWSGNFLLTFWDKLSVPPSRVLKLESIVCSETSASNYHYMLRNNPEERSFYLLRGGSLKSRNH